MQKPTIMRVDIKAGIDDLAFYIPKQYLPMETFAEARGQEYAKLRKGLGLEAMAIPDVYEDAATLAANAALKLIRRNELDPRTIGRIYIGTESAVDGSKPLASYVQGMLSDALASEYGTDCLLHCDVVDLTFACIGAVDAMQNCLDWIRQNPSRIGLVITTDIAKYDAESTGEYTQGAGAIAALLKQEPRLMTISEAWGVATEDVHDFYKPLRRLDKVALVKEVLSAAGLSEERARDLLGKLEEEGSSHFWADGAPIAYMHRETPVFDGPFSNNCYQDRIQQAFAHFGKQIPKNGYAALTDRWARMVFHLPYAYQARRMFALVYLQEAIDKGELDKIEAMVEQSWPRSEHFESEKDFAKARAGFLRALTKTDVYRAYVAEKIEKGERASSLVGNLYTGSLFLSLISSLEADATDGADLTGKRVGFFAYGSGSKSKVFEGELQPGWEQIAGRFGLMDFLAHRTAIDFDTYMQWHRGTLEAPMAQPEGLFALQARTEESGDQYGTRHYGWKPALEKVG